MIHAHGLTRRRGGANLIAVAALDIPARQVTSIIGPSGAGKTTLLRCIALVDEPDEGTLEIGEHSFTFPRARPDRHANGLWPTLTAVFQDLWLWDHLDLETNIRLPTQKNVGPAADARFAQLTEELDIGHLVGRYPHQVSGGERQRAAIARALMQEPTIVLLDEPTSASDVEHSHKLAELMRRLAAEEGMTVVLVTHHLGFAERVSDRVVFLDQGMVLQAGSVDLLKRTEDERVKRFVSVL